MSGGGDVGTAGRRRGATAGEATGRGSSPRDHEARPRRRRRRPAGDIGLNLTSMIDVVFLLLVYFMVATEFRSGEEVYKLDLPERDGAAASDPFEIDDEPLRIEVRSRGPVGDDPSLAAAGIAVPGPYPQPMDFRELRTLLEELLVGGPRGLFPRDHPVVVDPVGSTRWQHALAAFNAAAAAGYENVTFGGRG